MYALKAILDKKCSSGVQLLVRWFCHSFLRKMHAKPQNNFGRLIGPDGVAANFWVVWPGHARGKGADWKGVPQNPFILENLDGNVAVDFRSKHQPRPIVKI